MLRSPPPSTLLACALLAAGCHALIDADAHSRDDVADSGARPDTAVLDSGRDTGADDTGVPDAAPACASGWDVCGPQGVAACTPGGCQSCPVVELDAGDWLRTSSMESLDMPHAAFDLRIVNAGLGNFYGLVAAGIGAGVQRPRLGMVPLEPDAEAGTPPPVDLEVALRAWDTRGFVFVPAPSDTLLTLGVDALGGAHAAVGGWANPPTVTPMVTALGPGRLPRSRPVSAEVPTSAGMEPGLVWVAQELDGLGSVHYWAPEAGVEGAWQLLAPPTHHLRGSAGPWVLAQAMAEAAQVELYRVQNATGPQEIQLDATGWVDWTPLGTAAATAPPHFLAAVPRGNELALIEVDAGDCGPDDCVKTMQTSLSYSGQVITARIEMLESGFAVAAITDDGTTRRVELRILTKDLEVVPSTAEILAPSPDDWLAANTGGATEDLELTTAPIHDDVPHVGVAWADDDDTAGALHYLRAHFLVFGACPATL